MTSTIFALDIGTRSVVGIILQQQEDQYRVIDLLAIEHAERSMIDGQIHNVLSVTKVLQSIKQQLEEKHGPLKQVSVAAAGRSLKTVEGTITIDISTGGILSIEDNHLLELSAVQEAQNQLFNQLNEKQQAYYCVGYSVLHYTIDGEKIGSLIDQTGTTASVSVIATFLPQVVIDSLVAALKRADLEMEALTLEPIAAIQVLIPPSMRRLNVALVDIGAGTSDIALTDRDTVTAYGMVPIAGDEITEALSSEFLLDFPLAEQLKRDISSKDHVLIQDILGFEEEVLSEEVLNKIEPTLDKLAQEIGSEILRLNNGQPPKAVILIGGGSLTPTLPERLCQQLELPTNRVAIRGLDALSGVTTDLDLINSPDLITPIGIAIAARQSPIHYIPIQVNGRDIRLFEVQKMTVADALLAASISPRQLYGKPGHGMSITVNGRDIIIPGEHGTAPLLLLNGKPTTSQETVTSHDSIEVQIGKDGKDAVATPRLLLEDLTSYTIWLNEEPFTVEPIILRNGQPITQTTSLQDRDKIEVQQDFTIETIVKQKNHIIQYPEFLIQLDEKRYLLKTQQTQILVNDKLVLPTTNIRPNDRIIIKHPNPPTVKQLIQELEKNLYEQLSITFNGEALTLTKQRLAIKVNNHFVDEEHILHIGDHVQLIPTDTQPFVFSDVFTVSSFTLPKEQASDYQLLRNNEVIQFTDQIFGGDQLAIVFLSTN